jgi:outer membrane protein OmpA-like peptidoglycan-associated protein
MFGVQSPFVAGALTPHVMLLADYAHNPLVLRTISGNQNEGSIVTGQLFLHLNGGIALWNRLYVNADIPVAVVDSGGKTDVGNLPAAPSKAEFGDIRLGVRVRLWGEYWDPFQIAIGGYVWAPTGASNAFVSDGKVRGLPQLIVGGRTDRIVWSAALGPDLRASQTFPAAGSGVQGVAQGSMFDYGAGLGVLLLDNRHLQLGPEVYGSLSFSNLQKHNINAEVLVDLRYRVIDDLEIGLGIGPGITSGIGTPDLRGILMVAYTPEPKRDRDGDGILDPQDACPDVPGVRSDDPAKNGCPIPPDRDHDGIPDAEDACPDVPGVRTTDPKTNGCPPDRDGDKIIDVEDACPDDPGPPNPDPKKNGCPLPKDRDGDGIPDAEDACPDLPGPRNADPKLNGCPDRDGDKIIDPEDACPDIPGPPNADPKKNGCPLVHVTETEVFILEQVEFDIDRATIKKVSDGLLDNVAAVLKEHVELTKIEVQGHTDNTGNRGHNKTLSGQRADAVLKALVKRGIAARRLTSQGYGQDKPIADNGTAEGRQKNRRVQFVILQQKAKGAK